MKNKKTERKELSRQTYKFELVHYDDGTCSLQRENEGFSVLELLGISSLVQADMHQLMKESTEKSITNTERKSSNSPLIHKPKLKP